MKTRSFTAILFFTAWLVPIVTIVIGLGLQLAKVALRGFHVNDSFALALFIVLIAMIILIVTVKRARVMLALGTLLLSILVLPEMLMLPGTSGGVFKGSEIYAEVLMYWLIVAVVVATTLRFLPQLHAERYVQSHFSRGLIIGCAVFIAVTITLCAFYLLTRPAVSY